MPRPGDIRRSAPRYLELIAALFAVTACATSRSSNDCLATPHASAFERRITTTDLEGRPRLVLVEREGDPQSGATLAAAVDGGANVAWALSILIEQRLSALGVRATATAHGAGFWVHALLNDANDAQRFVQAVSSALDTPVAASQPLDALRSRLAAARLPQANEVELDVAHCSADAALTPKAETLSGNDTEARSQLERWRSSLALPTLALGVVGPEPMLDAVSSALKRAPALSARAALPDSFDPWPEADSLRAAPSTGDSAALSIALRLPSAARAQWVARRLVSDVDSLATIAGGLEPAWFVERASAIARPRGACLRIDLSNASGGTIRQAAALAELARSEVERLLPESDAPAWVLQNAVLGLDDPREAADVAAWQALSGRLDAGPERVAIAYSAPTPGMSAASFQQAQAELQQIDSNTSIRMQSAAEPGHGKLTVLLASPCGTLGESSSDAGELATMLTAVAKAYGDDGVVQLSPWITPEAVGLLAESDGLDSNETSSEQAERTARKLALALLAPLPDKAIHAARQSILSGFAKPAPDWWLALETLAPGQLSALSPSGSWTSVGSLVTDQILAARQLFASGPLRVAVLTGANEKQGPIVHDELERLLRPLRLADRQCPAVVPVKPGNGLFRLEAAVEPQAQALVGVSLPPANHWSRTGDAEWTVFLLNRKGGFIERRLLTPGLAIDARAHLLGGRRARALILELHTQEEKTDAAIAEARRLLIDLAGGGLTEPELQFARDFFDQQESRLSLDPRQRVVSLWQGSGPAPRPTLESLRRLHAEAFREDRQLVVVAQ